MQVTPDGGGDGQCDMITLTGGPKNMRATATVSPTTATSAKPRMTDDSRSQPRSIAAF